MFNLFKKIKNIPEKKKIIFYSQIAFLKNLAIFLFYIIVGFIFRSWFLIAIALYSVFIGIVRNNCSHGLSRSKDSFRDIHFYIQGGVILTISSVFYLAYSVSQIYYPSNTKYQLVIAIILAAVATFTTIKGILGVIKAKGKTMLIKEYKITNLASALTNIVLAQVAILSFTLGDAVSKYNGVLGVIVGFLIMTCGIYLIVDGYSKRRKCNQIISKNPEIVKYLNFD